MNMPYEGFTENATIVIVPSTVVETMQLGSLAGMTALTMGVGQERAPTAKAAAPLRLQQSSRIPDRDVDNERHRGGEVQAANAGKAARAASTCRSPLQNREGRES